MKKFGIWIECLFEKHKFVRRYVVFFGTILVGSILTKVFFIDNYSATITAPVATVLVSVIGLVAVCTTAYSMMREKE